LDTCPTIVVIAGPTGVGKTDLALGLAERLQTVIISADSRQCYKEMNIGVARPSPADLRRIPHFFIATHSITEHVNATTFVAEATRAMEGRDLVLVVGGTGLYIKALTEGLDPIPPVPDEIRRAVREGYAAGGLAWLQQEIAVSDPGWIQTGDLQNPHRLMRALEVARSTGRSIRTFQTGGEAAGGDGTAGHDGAAGGPAAGACVIKIGLDLPRQELYARIDKRVDIMMANGLLEEVEALLPYRDQKALHTVGYAELFDHLDGNTSLEEATALIKQHTRNYAKRQLTWFRRDPEMAWFAPGALDEVEAYVRRRLASF
jgi:tRNA dimethylallyltransferase